MCPQTQCGAKCWPAPGPLGSQALDLCTQVRNPSTAWFSPGRGRLVSRGPVGSPAVSEHALCLLGPGPVSGGVGGRGGLSAWPGSYLPCLCLGCLALGCGCLLHLWALFPEFAPCALGLQVGGGWEVLPSPPPSFRPAPAMHRLSGSMLPRFTWTGWRLRSMARA